MLLGGDFRQLLPIVMKGKRQDVVQVAINRSYIWDKCHMMILSMSMRVNNMSTAGSVDTRKENFNNWLLNINDGN